MKRIKTMLMVLMCISILGVPVLAATNNVEFRELKFSPAASSDTVLTSTSNMFDLSQNSGYAMYNATTIGTDEATSVKVSMVVQRKVNGVWESVPYTYKVDSTSSTRIITIEGSRFLEKGYWYRLQSVHTAYRGSTAYTEVMNSAMEWYN